jgi:hypothetical protein
MVPSPCTPGSWRESSWSENEMNITEIVRRSSLIMPVNQPRFVEKAYLRGAEALVLDLEDSVPPAEKERARTMVKEAIPVAARGGADVKEARKAEALSLAGVA